MSVHLRLPLSRKDFPIIEGWSPVDYSWQSLWVEQFCFHRIVSGLHRCVWIRSCRQPLTGLIQTTAPINPGDDGGLVVDSQENS